VPLKERRRTPGRRRLTLIKARLHNLQEIDFTVPLGLFVCVTGVSGSGKSTLVNDLLHLALTGQIFGGSGRLYGFDALHGGENVDQVVLVDQSPIGRSARSNPATYLQALGEIRDLLASTQEARKRGWTAGRFSFNVAGGRCPTCQGMGEVTVEMQFMADVTVPCEDCRGQRFEPGTLEVRYRGKNIAEILDLTVDEAIRFFADTPSLGARLWLLQRVGLGYLKLGQPAGTLSGGESQRIKIARELSTARKEHTLYLLDEPTTGLHAEDVVKLVRVLDDLVEDGNTVLVIEHNLDVIKNADHVVDLGPGGGPEGGRIVVAGPPESLVENENSVTGRYLAPLLAKQRSRR
jgi:excinuclease ABC subunit A